MACDAEPQPLSDARLDEFDHLEWWDVARRIDPAMTWERFERDWDEFVRLKAARVRLASETCGVSDRR